MHPRSRAFPIVIILVLVILGVFFYVAKKGYVQEIGPLLSGSEK